MVKNHSVLTEMLTFLNSMSFVELKQSLSEKSRELDKLKNEWTSYTTALSNKHSQELTSEKERALQVRWLERINRILIWEWSESSNNCFVSVLLTGTNSVPTTARTAEEGIGKFASEKYSAVAEQALGTRGHQ